MALVQWGGRMKVMHEGRLEGVSAASNPQKGDRERETEREREMCPHVCCRLLRW